jgi:hypothetical protein
LSTSNLSDFVTATADGANTKLTIDHDGTGALNSLVSIVITHTFTVFKGVFGLEETSVAKDCKTVADFV